MVRLLVDEDLPRTLVPALRSAGLEADDVRDVGLRGCSDDEVINYSTAHGMAVVTGDVGIGNLLHYPLGTHGGLIVARFPNELPANELTAEIVRAISELTEEEISGNLVVIEPGRVRLRRSR